MPCLRLTYGSHPEERAKVEAPMTERARDIYRMLRRKPLTTIRTSHADAKSVSLARHDSPYHKSLTKRRNGCSTSSGLLGVYPAQA